MNPHDPIRAVDPHEVVPLGGRPGEEPVQAQADIPTLESLLDALRKLKAQTDSASQIRPAVLTNCQNSNTLSAWKLSH
ncbi:MAG TPA: hypothetical protein VMF08_20400 [Candidatus Sulfotelmatobacter sp.]|nr:hypothetical protein [Candidatus Sulfotelmatobacter sp.]